MKLFYDDGLSPYAFTLAGKRVLAWQRSAIEALDLGLNFSYLDTKKEAHAN